MSLKCRWCNRIIPDKNPASLGAQKLSCREGNGTFHACQHLHDIYLHLTNHVSSSGEKTLGTRLAS